MSGGTIVKIFTKIWHLMLLSVTVIFSMFNLGEAAPVKILQTDSNQKFILKTTANDKVYLGHAKNLIANNNTAGLAHYSHRSHSSHMSHRSHYSSY
jgi:hypothetical protein